MKPIKTPASAQADQTRQTASNHSEPIQQVAAESMFVDNRPEMTAQRQRLNMMSNSPQIQQQKARQNSINNSPQTLAQLKQHSALFGTPLQRQETEKEPLQGQSNTAQRQEQPAPKPNNTGLPNQLKSGIESLSGMSMDHVKVHYNSSQPAQLNALAYAQGSDIHVGPGQEQHLPHEAWHVVQQAQGRVKPTMQMKEGVPVNDDAGLEHEADVMGAKASNYSASAQTNTTAQRAIQTTSSSNPIQRYATWWLSGWTYTENSKYAMSAGDTDNSLWVKNTASPPSPADFFEVSATQKGWKEYKPRATFTNDASQWTTDYFGPNDCGFYAYALHENQPQWGNANLVNFRDKTNDNPLNGKNNYDADLTNEGVNADPGVGETYWMWRTYTKAVNGDSPGHPACNHHAATVIASDGGDKVTSESDASLTLGKPVFHFHGSQNNQTFYEKYKHYYSAKDDSDPARLGVFKPKPDDASVVINIV